MLRLEISFRQDDANVPHRKIERQEDQRLNALISALAILFQQIALNRLADPKHKLEPMLDEAPSDFHRCNLQGALPDGSEGS